MCATQTQCLSFFYMVQGMHLSFSGVAVTMDLKRGLGADPVAASRLSSLVVAGWCLKPLYGLGVDRAGRLFESGSLSPWLEWSASPMVWGFVGALAQFFCGASVALWCGGSGGAISAGWLFVGLLLGRNTGSALCDVMVDAVQCRAIAHLDGLRSRGADGLESQTGSSHQANSSALRVAGAGVSAVAGAVAYEALGGRSVWLLQVFLDGLQIVALFSLTLAADAGTASRHEARCPLSAASRREAGHRREQRRRLAAAPLTGSASARARRSLLAERAASSEAEAEAAPVARPALAAGAAAAAGPSGPASPAAAEPSGAAAAPEPERAAPPAPPPPGARRSSGRARMAAFMLLYNGTPGMGETWTYYLLDVLGLTPSLLGLTGMVLSLVSACGSLLYKRSRFSSRRRSALLLRLGLVQFVLGFGGLLFVSRPWSGSAAWGEPWAVSLALVAVSAPSALAGGLMQPAVMHASAEVSAGSGSGVAGSFSLIMTAHNVGGVVSGLLSASLCGAMGVSADSFGRLGELVVLVQLIGLASLPLVALVPDGRVEAARGYAAARQESSDTEDEDEPAAPRE